MITVVNKVTSITQLLIVCNGHGNEEDGGEEEENVTSRLTCYKPVCENQMGDG